MQISFSETLQRTFFLDNPEHTFERLEENEYGNYGDYFGKPRQLKKKKDTSPL